jgi:peptidoglycan/LPS O-acetylase OafA/YrhL
LYVIARSYISYLEVLAAQVRYSQSEERDSPQITNRRLRNRALGYYRLILAFMVVADHMNIKIYHYSPGIVAVISFFLLSGYVMTALLQKYYPSLSSVPVFYLDRLFRLGPQFYFYSFITLIALLSINMHHNLMMERPTLIKGISKFAVLPLNFSLDVLASSMVAWA